MGSDKFTRLGLFLRLALTVWDFGTYPRPQLQIDQIDQRESSNGPERIGQVGNVIYYCKDSLGEIKPPYYDP
jgi:hypothetical protein